MHTASSRSGGERNLKIAGHRSMMKDTSMGYRLRGRYARKTSSSGIYMFLSAERVRAVAVVACLEAILVLAFATHTVVVDSCSALPSMHGVRPRTTHGSLWPQAYFSEMRHMHEINEMSRNSACTPNKWSGQNQDEIFCIDQLKTTTHDV